VLGLIAMGLGTIIRHTAGAISAFVGMLLILPLIIQALPYQLSVDVRRFMPDRIGVHMITTKGILFDSFTPWTGMLILCLYAVGVLIIGLLLLERRDA
jgi:ABC-2 type transport system permease protein